MARQIVLIDDLDGKTKASQTVTYALDGIEYEIDLSDANAAKLRDAMASFIASSRKVGKAAKAAKPVRQMIATGGPSNDEIRTWAKAQGLTVGDKGRIANDIVEAYAKAH